MDVPIRVLVADDDAPTRRLLAAALTSERLYEVVTARGADEALGFFQSSPGFDVIVTDLTMPGVSGLELIQKVRVLNTEIPILVLSSMHTDQSLARALEAGADDYLQKPVDLRELRRAVAFLIERRQKQSLLQKGPEQSAEAANISTSPPVFTNVPPPFVRNIANGTFVELTALNDPLQAERFQRFAERLLAASLTEKERADLRLALEEIVANAMEWGNQNDRNKTLRLSYCLLPDRITFRIEDEGEGFDIEAWHDPSRDPRAHLDERRASGKRIGGWGIFLTRKTMDEVTYNRKGNVVFLTKYLPRAAQPVLPNSAGTAHTDDPDKLPATNKPSRRTTRMIRKTTRLLKKDDPRFKEA